MTAKQFIEIQNKNRIQIAALEQEIYDAREKVEIPPKNRLRKMRPEDVVVGQVVYHDLGQRYRTEFNEEPWYWHIIETVRHPNDLFKAYVAEDGCRYGLNEAYVEID